MIILFYFLSFLDFGQINPQITRIDNTEIIKTIHSIDTPSRFESDNFSLKIFKKSNPPGSAGISGGHEISHSFYLAISEFDEYPLQSLFLLGGFYNPEYTVEKEENSLVMKVKHGAYDNRKEEKVKIELHKVTKL